MRKHLGGVASAWLGITLGTLTGFHMSSWEWWVIVVPTIIVFAAKKD